MRNPVHPRCAPKPSSLWNLWISFRAISILLAPVQPFRLLPPSNRSFCVPTNRSCGRRICSESCIFGRCFPFGLSAVLQSNPIVLFNYDIHQFVWADGFLLQTHRG
ncbi:hypothetical protein OG21DRAFT_747193 [Imleria badia]|nr:hypothetical protein OG21DRAFT_747193 [Imleria badia]